METERAICAAVVAQIRWERELDYWLSYAAVAVDDPGGYRSICHRAGVAKRVLRYWIRREHELRAELQDLTSGVPAICS